MRSFIAISAFLVVAAACLSPAEAVEVQIAKMSSRATFGEKYDFSSDKISHRGLFMKICGAIT